MLFYVKKLVRPWIYRIVTKASRSYVSGESLSDALQTSEILLNLGYSVTVGYWNKDEEEANNVSDIYQAAIDKLKPLPNNNYLSIKAPAIKFNTDFYASILSKARLANVPLHFDSLSHEDTDITFSLIEKHTNNSLNDIGCTLPGRWLRSIRDAEWAAEMGLNIRIVKGQWQDPHDPDRDPALGFLEIVEKLAGKAFNVRIASHDEQLVRQSIHILKKANTSCEIELLYGLPVKEILPIAKEMNIPVRLYIPYGASWVPYSLDSALKNPRVLWWVFKDSLLGSYIERFPRQTLEAV